MLLPLKNRIVQVTLTLGADEAWSVEVLKEFAPEHGGGTQVFREPGSASIHRALDVAREMVTVSPGQRSPRDIAADMDRANRAVSGAARLADAAARQS